MRLSRRSVLPSSIMRPAYDRDAQAAGIVHFGIGAFHRAHQAVYTDDAMNAGDQDWMITGVSLRSESVATQLQPQDGLYTVTARSAKTEVARLIGSVRNVLVASDTRTGVVAALAAPATHIITLTITEKGYCRDVGGSLDLSLADEASVFAYLTAGLRQRRDSGLAGLTLLCCDNLANNGAQLKRLMHDYLGKHDPGLIAWFDAECTCPATMVDRIVPATTEADLDRLEAQLGCRDEGAVFAEPFSQWVIEDRFANTRPRWETSGAEFVTDVAPYETAKLRMLNGAHSALAYIGLQRGHEFVHEAIADPQIAAMVRTLMIDEAAPTITAAPGQNLAAYAEALIERFRNSATNHRLIQIAMDGSQKIPQRWLQTLAIQQERGKQCPALLSALAAWIAHIRGDRFAVDDPLASVFADAWRSNGRAGIVDALFHERSTFGIVWYPTVADKLLLEHALGHPTG